MWSPPASTRLSSCSLDFTHQAGDSFFWFSTIYQQYALLAAKRPLLINVLKLKGRLSSRSLDIDVFFLFIYSSVITNLSASKWVATSSMHAASSMHACIISQVSKVEEGYQTQLRNLQSFFRWVRSCTLSSPLTWRGGREKGKFSHDAAHKILLESDTSQTSLPINSLQTVAAHYVFFIMKIKLPL